MRVEFHFFSMYHVNLSTKIAKPAIMLNLFKISTFEAEYLCYLLFVGKAQHGVGLQRWKKGGIYKGALRVTLNREVWDRIGWSRSWVLQRSGRGGVLINFQGTIH